MRCYEVSKCSLSNWKRQIQKQEVRGTMSDKDKNNVSEYADLVRFQEETSELYSNSVHQRGMESL